MKTKLNKGLFFAAIFVAAILFFGLAAESVDARPASTKSLVAEKASPKPTNVGLTEAKSVSSISNSKSLASQNKIANSKAKKVCSNKGDVNNDGRVNFFDNDGMRLSVSHSQFMEENHPEMYTRADMNSDGSVDQTDIDLFLEKALRPGSVCKKDKNVAKEHQENLRAERLGAGSDSNGDVNYDGAVDFFDIDYFNLVMNYPSFMKLNHPTMFANADMNDDGYMTEQDTELFLSSIFSN